MDPIDWASYCQQRFHTDAPRLAETVGTVTDLMELALLAALLPDTVARWGSDAPVLQVGFREAVRDRYQELIAAQSRQAPLTR